MKKSPPRLPTVRKPDPADRERLDELFEQGRRHGEEISRRLREMCTPTEVALRVRVR